MESQPQNPELSSLSEFRFSDLFSVYLKTTDS